MKRQMKSEGEVATMRKRRRGRLKAQRRGEWGAGEGKEEQVKEREKGAYEKREEEALKSLEKRR